MLHQTHDFDVARNPAPAPQPDAKVPWATPPTFKARAGLERAVVRLLDALAPEQTVIRAARPPRPVERHRTPRGCILQAPAAAVSVSWFPDAATEMVFGELQVLAWRGVVSRPGSARRAPGGASIAGELMLRPEGGDTRPEDVAREWAWRADDGTLYDAGALAAHCLALLEQQLEQQPDRQPA